MPWLTDGDILIFDSGEICFIWAIVVTR